MKKIIHVVAAAIMKDNKFLCAKRPTGKALAGFWEFPGGKLEPGENPEDALIREIKEEFNADIQIISFVNEASYDYDFGTVIMKTYITKLVSESLELLEHDDMAWLEPKEFDTLTWAPVDIPAVKMIQQIKMD